MNFHGITVKNGTKKKAIFEPKLGIVGSKAVVGSQTEPMYKSYTTRMATNNDLLTSIVPLLKMFLEIGINNLCLTPSGLGFPNHYQIVFTVFESRLDKPDLFNTRLR